MKINLLLKIVTLAFTAFTIQTQSQIIWTADPDESTNINHFFRRLDAGNYPQDYCYQVGDERGVTPSTSSTIQDGNRGKVWKINKPRNRKRGEFARAEGDRNFYASKNGDDIYIGWEFKINSNKTINEEVTVWQWKTGGGNGNQNYPINMEYDGDLTLNAFGPDWYNGNFPSQRRSVLWRKKIPQNTWVSFIVHLKLSDKDKDSREGYVEFWYNGEPQTFTLENKGEYSVDLSSNKRRAFHRTYDNNDVYPKWGAYNKNSCAFDIDVFLNNLKISNDLESILGPSTPSNNPPTVIITAPRNNATFEVGESINLQASASDPDGNLDKVNFKINGDFYKTDTDRPFENSFTPSQPGTYEIAAKAFDSEGLAKEVKVTIEVKPAVIPNRTPEVSITSPQNGAIFIVGEEIVLSANASDADGNLDRVNFKINDNFYATDINSPFTSTFTATDPGTYLIGAKAFDEGGLAKEVTVTIEVKPIPIPNRAPEVNITSPQDGAVFVLGEEIRLSANASDADDNLDKVNFKINDNFYSTDINSPYTGNFTPTEPGDYKIAARAFDSEGMSTEVFVSITVSDPALSTNDFFNNTSTKIKIYPNPSRDVLNISGFQEQDTEINIIDLNGKIIKTEVISKIQNQVTIQNLPSGLYFINFYKKAKFKTLNFIKK